MLFKLITLTSKLDKNMMRFTRANQQRRSFNDERYIEKHLGYACYKRAKP